MIGITKDIKKPMEFWQHLTISALIRFGLVVLIEMVDNIYDVSLTDIDYRVVTDGSRYVLNNESPYTRHTYRYSPILSYLLIPNIYIHPAAGKVIYSMIDLLVGILIKEIACIEMETRLNEMKCADGKSDKNAMKLKRTSNEEMGIASSLLWLYNPYVVFISVRGNGDCISSAFILLTIYNLMKLPSKKLHTDKNVQYYFAGIFHAIAIHLRLYPIVYSLTYYFYLSNDKQQEKFYSHFLWPNLKQMTFVIATILNVLLLTGIFYYIYGYSFLYESYIYHTQRTDVRHNFSIYFYMQYLYSSFQLVDHQSGAPSILNNPQLYLILWFSYSFSNNRKAFILTLFIETVVMVIYNPVITSQYYIWIFSILPIFYNSLRTRLSGKRMGIAACLLFLAVKGIWLIIAYTLEFLGWNVFPLLFCACIIFHIGNLYILLYVLMVPSKKEDKNGSSLVDK